MVAGFAYCLARYSWTVPALWFTAVDALAVAGAVLVIVQLWRLARGGTVASYPLVAVASVVPFLPWIVRSGPWPEGWELPAGLAVLSALVARETPGSRARWIAPAALAVAVLWALLDPAAASGRWPGKRFSFYNDVIGTLSTFAFAWNFWHVYMQKYGILRVYSAKAGRKVPAWVDRLLMFGWLPLTFVVVGPAHRTFLLSRYGQTKGYLVPILDGLEAARPWLLPLTIGIAAASVLCFARYEWKAHRLQNLPRLSMALGTTMLFASMLVVNPVKAVLAFGFSHVLEYFVFVWAYERRRYCSPLPHRPPLAALLRHPAIAYPLFLLLVGGGYFVFSNWGTHVFRGAKPLRPFGAHLHRFLMLFVMFQAMTHFYFDGFLWKMRQPAVSRNI
jgi:hypothetical protein